MWTFCYSFYHFFYCFTALAAPITSTTLPAPTPLHYLEVQTEQPEAALLLLAGFAQHPEQILLETPFPRALADAQIVPILFGAGHKLWLDTATASDIHHVLEHFFERHPSLKEKPLFLGGFSAGGTLAMRYAQVVQKATQWPNVKAVFAIDAPLDLARFWTRMQAIKRYSHATVAQQEAAYILNVFKQQLGTPESHPEIYRAHSPYAAQAPALAYRHLRHLAVRVYHSIDINWLLEARGHEALDANFIDGAAFIRALRHEGHTNAEFIQSTQKGIRSTGQYHPHAWSILDIMDSIDWLQAQY